MVYIQSWRLNKTIGFLGERGLPYGMVQYLLLPTKPMYLHQPDIWGLTKGLLQILNILSKLRLELESIFSL